MHILKDLAGSWEILEVPSKILQDPAGSLQIIKDPCWNLQDLKVYMTDFFLFA